MRTPIQGIPLLELEDIDFAASKRMKTEEVETTTLSVSRAKSPSLSEKDFFNEIATEESKLAIYFVVPTHSDKFVQDGRHLPKALHGLWKQPIYKVT